MLAVLRQFARPLGIVLALLSLPPVHAVPCAEAASGDVMPCCLDTGTVATTLDGECCTLREQAPEPDRDPAVLGRAGTLSGAPATPTPADVVTLVGADRACGSVAALDSSPPLERLYLRLSNIRR
jgi:hypothetical protein